MQRFFRRLGFILLLGFSAVHGGSASAASAKTPPAFDLHPQATNVVDGAKATMTARASGSPTPTYQWERQEPGGWKPVAGATSATLSITAKYATDNGAMFRAVATNASGSKNSNAAKLTVTPVLTITANPQNQTVLAGAAATFSVTATGSGTLTYQWYSKSGNGAAAAIAQATKASYTTPATTAAMSGTTYFARVTAGTLTKDSTSASLTVTQPPTLTISANPQSQTVAVGKTATFSVTATTGGTGAVAPSYQWFAKPLNGTAAAIAQATKSTYTTGAATAAMTGTAYFVRVTSGALVKESTPATLTVTVPLALTIDTQPQNQTVAVGQAATFSVTATASGTGAAAPTYQWFSKPVGGTATAIAQATKASYTTAAATSAMSGTSYSVIVTSGGLSKESNAATLTVAAAVTPGTFTPASASMYKRAYATVTRLNDGRILVIGGWDLNAGYMAAQFTAEIYDPATGMFKSTGNLNEGRQGHNAVLLKDGRVLITGGRGSNGFPVLSSEIYDPATGVFQSLGKTLITPRMEGFAFLLANGKVLMFGGIDAFNTSYVNASGYVNEWQKPVLSSQLYDPVTNTVAASGSLRGIGRNKTSTATQLADGRILVTGGQVYALVIPNYPDPQWRRLDDAEIYDPATGVFTTLTGKMPAGRANHQAVLLKNGKVLLAAGNTWNTATLQQIEARTASALLFDPSSQTFAAAGSSMVMGRDNDFTMTVLSSGRVMAVGGYKPGGYYDLAEKVEIYDPVTGVFAQVGTLARMAQRVIELPNGTVLVIGGRDGANSFPNMIYTPSN